MPGVYPFFECVDAPVFRQDLHDLQDYYGDRENPVNPVNPVKEISAGSASSAGAWEFVFFPAESEVPARGRAALLSLHPKWRHFVR